MAIYFRKILDKSEEEDMSYKKHYTKGGVELIAFQKAWLEDKYGSKGEPRLGTASFTTKTEGKMRTRTDAACSADFRYAPPSDVLYWVKKAYEMESRLPAKTADAFYKWLFNDSHWAPAFRTKKVLYAKRYGVELETSQHGGLVYGATIALRIWEYPSIAVAWHTLVKEGVHPNMAYLVAHWVSLNEGKFNTKKSPISTGHIAIEPNRLTNRLGYTKSFVHGKLDLPLTERDKFYSSRYGRNVNRFEANHVFHRGEQGTEVIFRDVLNRWSREQRTANTKNLNPFASANLSNLIGVGFLATKLKEYTETLRDKS